MKLFSALYQRVIRWPARLHGPHYMVGLSFTESSFFPLTPDVVLTPMAWAKPERAWFYTGLTTLMSVSGGVFGYLIGASAFEFLVALFIATYFTLNSVNG